MPLNDEQEAWYLDIGASANMTPFDCDLSSKSPYSGIKKS